MKQNIPKLRKRMRGLSMVELLIAIFVVSVGVLGTVSALWYGIRSERYSDRRSNAVYQAREMLNQIRAKNYPFIAGALTQLNDGDYDSAADDNGPRKAFNAPPFENFYPTNPYNFERRVEIKMMSNNANSHLSDLAAIKVTLWWTEGASEKSLTLYGMHRRQP